MLLLFRFAGVEHREVGSSYLCDKKHMAFYCIEMNRLFYTPYASEMYSFRGGGGGRIQKRADRLGEYALTLAPFSPSPNISRDGFFFLGLTISWTLEACHVSNQLQTGLGSDLALLHLSMDSKRENENGFDQDSIAHHPTKRVYVYIHITPLQIPAPMATGFPPELDCLGWAGSTFSLLVCSRASSCVRPPCPCFSLQREPRTNFYFYVFILQNLCVRGNLTARRNCALPKLLLPLRQNTYGLDPASELARWTMRSRVVV